MWCCVYVVTSLVKPFFKNFLILASGLKEEGKKDKGMALLPTTGKWGVVPPHSLTSSRFPELSGSFHLGIFLSAHTVVFRPRIGGYNGSIVVCHHHLWNSSLTSTFPGFPAMKLDCLWNVPCKNIPQSSQRYTSVLNVKDKQDNFFNMCLGFYGEWKFLFIF